MAGSQSPTARRVASRTRRTRSNPMAVSMGSGMPTRWIKASWLIVIYRGASARPPTQRVEEEAERHRERQMNRSLEDAGEGSHRRRPELERRHPEGECAGQPEGPPGQVAGAKLRLLDEALGLGDPGLFFLTQPELQVVR